MEGYWNQPEATAGAIVDGWFHTGDGGSIDEFGYVTISDRKKDVIISGGENVSSIEVEDAIFQHPDVTEVAVIGIPDEKWGELVTALVVKTPGSDLSAEDVIAWTAREAGRLQVPEARRVPRRPRPHRHRQAAEVQAPRPVLGRPAAPGQLIRPGAPSRPARMGAAGATSARGLETGDPHVNVGIDLGQRRGPPGGPGPADRSRQVRRRPRRSGHRPCQFRALVVRPCLVGVGRCRRGGVDAGRAGDVQR